MTYIDETASFAHPAGEPVDLRHLDGTLANLRRAARDASTIVAFLTEARDRLAAAPDDPEARQAVKMAELRMRGDAYALAQDFSALAREGAP